MLEEPRMSDRTWTGSKWVRVTNHLSNESVLLSLTRVYVPWFNNHLASLFPEDVDRNPSDMTRRKVDLQEERREPVLYYPFVFGRDVIDVGSRSQSARLLRLQLLRFPPRRERTVWGDG